jgi:hypothetical protein
MAIWRDEDGLEDHDAIATMNRCMMFGYDTIYDKDESDEPLCV